MKKIINFKYALIFISAVFFIVDCHSQSSTITMWKDSAMGAIWNKATNTVAYGKPDANGIYKIYLSDTLGNNEKPLTYAGWRSDRQQAAAKWDPSGNYLICYVEKADYNLLETGHTRVPVDAIPGYGGYTDIWLLSRDGTQAWQLTNLPNNYDSGLLHCAISNDGSMFAWTERIKAPVFLDFNLMTGTNVFRVADFVDGPIPGLNNIRTFQPGGVAAGGELESISNDKTTIAFYSTFETKNILTTPIYTLHMNTNQILRLTTESFSQSPTYAPDGNHLVYMTGKGCDIFPWEIQGADWWIMNTDSTNKQRISYMNVTNNSQSVNHYRLAGSLSFMSNTSFLGGVMTQPGGLVGYTAKVSFNNLTTGIENKVNNSAPDFFLFPNPASDLLNVTINNNTDKTYYSICNLIGSKVAEGVFAGGSSPIDVSNYPDGMYVLKLSDGKTDSIQKFLVKKK